MIHIQNFLEEKHPPRRDGRMPPCLMTQSILVHQDPKYERAPNLSCFNGHKLLANKTKLAGDRGFRVSWFSNSIMPFGALFLSVHSSNHSTCFVLEVTSPGVGG